MGQQSGRHEVIAEVGNERPAVRQRWVLTTRASCSRFRDRIVPLGERHSRRAVVEYVEHYHRERNQQGLDNRLIATTPVATAGRGCDAVLGWAG
jgi:hypothetical protein